MHLQVELVAGQSAVVSSRARSPLHLLNPANAGHATWVFQSSHGGGFVGDDDVSLSVDVRAGAALFLSSQASSKVYRSTRARYALDAKVHADGTLVLWPDPVVCFAGASLEQRLSFSLEPGASLVCVDALTAGRAGVGERWRFRRYESRIDVRIDGDRCLQDAVVLSDAHGLLAQRMEGVGAIATVVLAGDRLEGACEALHARVHATPLAKLPEGTLCTGSRWPWGLVLRAAAPSQETLQRALRELLSGVTAQLLGDDPLARKW